LVIVDVGCGNEQTVDVDVRGLTEQDTVLVDDHNIAVGVQGAVDD